MSQNHVELIARAVIRRGEELLLAHSTDKDWHFLPGGHVELGEAAAVALRRELEEELGVHDARVGDIVAVTETRYVDVRGEHHEINLVFKVEVEPDVQTSREDHLGFAWFPLSDVASLEIRPAPIAKFLATGLGRSGIPFDGEGFEENQV